MRNAWVFASIFHSSGKWNKTHRMGRTWKIGIHTFPIVWICIISIQFPSYGILPRIGNAWVFPLISHSSGKWNKTHCMGRIWEIVAHTFPVVWVLFSITFPSCGIFHHMRNAWVSTSMSHSMGNCNEIHRIGRVWETGTHTFCKVWVLFFHQIPILVMLYHMKNAWLFPSISNGKCSKTHPHSSQVVFPRYSFFYLFQNLMIPWKNKQRKEKKSMDVISAENFPFLDNRPVPNTGLEFGRQYECIKSLEYHTYQKILQTDRSFVFCLCLDKYALL